MTKSPQDTVRPEFILADHFLDLSPPIREGIARKLNIMPAEYKELPRIHLSKMIFMNAKTEGKVAELWEEVEKAHPEGKVSPNPFSK